jgi:hypothetical protein
MKLKITPWKDYYNKEYQVEFNNKDILTILIATTLSALISFSIYHITQTQDYIQLSNNQDFNLFLTIVIYSLGFLGIILFFFLTLYRVVIFIGWLFNILIYDIIWKYLIIGSYLYFKMKIFKDK